MSDIREVADELVQMSGEDVERMKREVEEYYSKKGCPDIDLEDKKDIKEQNKLRARFHNRNKFFRK